MSAPDTITMPYARLIERRDKAVKLDMGEAAPVWFPLHKITLDEDGYTVTAPRDMMDEKMAEATGEIPPPPPTSGNRLIRLAPPAWENDKSIGVDVIVKSGGKTPRSVETRVFFPKSKLERNAAPEWFVKKKEREIIAAVAEEKNIDPATLTVTGLIADDRSRKGAGGYRPGRKATKHV